MNKVTLMGRLTKDPEMKYTGNNVACTNFTLAVNRRFNKPGEEKQADFLNIVVWNKTGEFCGNYFKKGMQVVVCGRIQIRTWDNPEGKRQYFTEIVAEEAYFADSKRDNYTENKGDAQEATKKEEGGFYPVNEDDDELPF